MQCRRDYVNDNIGIGKIRVGLNLVPPRRCHGKSPIVAAFAFDSTHGGGAPARKFGKQVVNGIAARGKFGLQQLQAMDQQAALYLTRDIARIAHDRVRFALDPFLRQCFRHPI